MQKIEYNYDWYTYDKGIMKDFNWFFRKINQRAAIAQGFTNETYVAERRDGSVDYGLGENVEYFHPTITLDDRMRYIIENIAPADIGKYNILGNTIISHFYGARGVHSTVTGISDPKKSFVDFERIAANDNKYIQHLRNTTDIQTKVNKLPIWGTTELHTSIQTAGRNYCREKYNEPERKFHPIDVSEWVASFITDGTMDYLLNESDHIEKTYQKLREKRGIGEYYGFHCAASTSVLPFVRYHHDQRFVAPGPGAVYTINRIWPSAPKKLYAEAIYFLREQGDEIGLTDGVQFYEGAYNIGNNFDYPQDSLKYYGTEVMSCQFGIYLQIRDDKKACERRKVSRIEKANTLEGLL